MTIYHENAYNVNSILKSKKSSTFSELDKADQSYQRFLRGIKTKSTLTTYEHTFNQFCSWAEYESYNAITQTDPKEIQQTILDYMDYLKNEGKRHGTIKACLSSIRLFFIQNDIQLNVELLKKNLGHETKQLYGRRAYKLEQVQAMLEAVRMTRTKALITTLASSGMRKGAIPLLKVGNLKRQSDGGALVVVYEGEMEEYVTGLTPEAVFFIDKMLAERRKNGLTVNDDSFIFTRDSYGSHRKTERPLNEFCINNIMQDTIASAKVDRKQDPVSKRCEISTVHGLRKFFKTTCHSVKYAVEDKSVQAIETVIIEQLMGHSQKTVKMTYLDTSEKDLYAEYQKAIPALTISQEWRLKQQNKELQQQVAKPELETMEKISKLEAIITKQQEQIEELKKPAFEKDMNGELEEGQPSLVSQLLKELSGIQQAQQKQESVSPKAN